MSLDFVFVSTQIKRLTNINNENRKDRCEQGSNLRGKIPLDFKSNALTTRPKIGQTGLRGWGKEEKREEGGGEKMRKNEKKTYTISISSLLSYLLNIIYTNVCTYYKVYHHFNFHVTCGIWTHAVAISQCTAALWTFLKPTVGGSMHQNNVLTV